MKSLIKMLLGLITGLGMSAGFILFIHVNPARAVPTADQTQVIQSALAYLKTQQQEDGGMLGFSGTSDPDTTARSVMAFYAVGASQGDLVAESGVSMLDYLSAQAVAFTHDITGTLLPGRAGLLLAAVSLAHADVGNFGGMDIVGELEATYQPDTGAYSTTAKQDFSSGEASDLNQAWSILGLSLTGRRVPVKAADYLVSTQAADGSWGFGDPDTTALAVTALLSSRKVGAQEDSIQNALKYFDDTQLENAGWRPSWDTDPMNADSTGWIIQALTSAGESLLGGRWVSSQGNAFDALMGLQKPDGAIGGTYANPYSTADALVGLSGVTLSSLGLPVPDNRAGVAVFSGEGSVITSCVSFAEPNLNSLNLLKQSGLSVETATNPNQGTAVCSIEGTGCQPSDCFCGMPNYWSFWQSGDEGWEYASVGAEQSLVRDGGVNAWFWASGDPPAMISFENICEGVPFVREAAQQTEIPATNTPESTVEPTVLPATSAPQPTALPAEPQAGMNTYIFFGAIVLVLGLVVIFLMRSRRRA